MWKALLGIIIGGSIGDGFYVLLHGNGYPDLFAAAAGCACVIGGAWIGWNSA